MALAELGQSITTETCMSAPDHFTHHSFAQGCTMYRCGICAPNLSAPNCSVGERSWIISHSDWPYM